MSRAARCPIAWGSKFSNFVVWPSCACGLWVCPVSPPLVSHTQGLWWHMTFDDVILASSVYIIPSFACGIKGPHKYHLGLLFPKQQWDRGLGSDLDLGVTSTLVWEWISLHSSLWISLTLATMIYTLCVKYCLLCYLVISNLSIYSWLRLINSWMCIGTEGTTPGVERRKELSLLVEEWCSPESP